MSENSEFDRTAADAETEADAGEVSEGQYVEGDYGKAGTAGENPATAEEGEYAAGDYGEAGTAGASTVGDEEGDYPEGDYGKAGGVGGEPLTTEEGEYPEGDYGAAGTAGAEGSGRRAPVERERAGGDAAPEPTRDER